MDGVRIGLTLWLAAGTVRARVAVGVAAALLAAQLPWSGPDFPRHPVALQGPLGSFVLSTKLYVVMAMWVANATLVWKAGALPRENESGRTQGVAQELATPG